MNAWDILIKNKGTPVTVYVITVAVYDDYNALDWENSTKTSYETVCMPFPEVSGPTLTKSPQGWGDNEPFKAYFPTNITIPSNTGEIADIVEMEGKRYRIEASDWPTYGRLKRNAILLMPLPGENQG